MHGPKNKINDRLVRTIS